jgi:hypothetical protein
MMKSKAPTPEHTAFRDDLVAVLKKHDGLKPDEMLAVASYFVGQLIALQDQRRMTADMAMAVVSSNIEAGNMHAMKEVASASSAAKN